MADILSPYGFSTVSSASQDGMWKEVPVPNQLYDEVTLERPLAGTRLSLKDNFQLSGTKTTMMGRDYTELYPPMRTAPTTSRY